jgi:UDP-glucose 4-epimerase
VSADMPEPSVVVVGRSGFIARTIASAAAGAGWRFVAHDRVGTLDGVECVVNCALPPVERVDDVPVQALFDLRLARLAARAGARYVMLSSRKVYDPACQVGADEAAPVRPVDAYGRNKARAVQAVLDLLGERATVLRLANVIGWEPGRRSFMGMMLSSLGRGEGIRLDVSPFVERDFLPVERLADMVVALVGRKAEGILNVGSGIGTPVGRLALWVIDGAGRGDLTVTSTSERDAFRLDVGRLAGLLGHAPAAGMDLGRYCRALGQRLKDESHHGA